MVNIKARTAEIKFIFNILKIITQPDVSSSYSAHFQWNNDGYIHGNLIYSRIDKANIIEKACYQG